MKRSTNKFILKYSLLSICIFAIYAAIFPNILDGTNSPTIIHHVGIGLWTIGVIGMFVFWAWGLMANVASLFIHPFENEKQAGRLKPNSFEDRILRASSAFKLLNIYVERD